MLAAKLKGLMGERAAVDRFQRNEEFLKSVFKYEEAKLHAIGRGVRYGSDGRSFDIVVHDKRLGTVYAEVKNWSAETWASEEFRNRALRQLREHNEGIAQHAAMEAPRRTVHSRLLMVVDTGWDALAESERVAFEASVTALGWTIEKVPGKGIPDFKQMIDSLR